MANHLGRVGAMAQGRAPFDAKAAADNAAIVVTMSKLPWVAFGEGTDKGSRRAPSRRSGRTRAKFKDLQGKMQAEAEKFEAAAKTGNLDNIKAAVGDAGQQPARPATTTTAREVQHQLATIRGASAHGFGAGAVGACTSLRPM